MGPVDNWLDLIEYSRDEAKVMMKVMYAITVLFLMSWGSISEARTWTSQDGKTMEAEFVKVEKGRVWLRGDNGKVIRINFSKFVEEDQTLIKELYLELKAEAAAEKVAEAEKAAGEKAAVRDAVLAKWRPGQISRHVTSNSTQASYHVYMPTSFDPDKPPALVYAFSPGGNGHAQLNAMKPSAEKHGWIVVGCDKLKNGMGKGDLRKEAIKIEDAIIADVQASVPHDTTHVYLSGMSGGAMRSYRLAARRRDVKFAGILAFGGWMGGAEHQQQGYPKGMAVAMINGDTDKNANFWVEGDSKVLKKYKWKVQYFSFPGGHTMAPPDVINKAIEWILTQPLPK
jgi:predicted esterase